MDTNSPPIKKPEISEKPAFLMQHHPQQQKPQQDMFTQNQMRSPSPVVKQMQQMQMQANAAPQPQVNRQSAHQSRWNASPVPGQQQQHQEAKPLTVFNNVSAPKVTPVSVSPATNGYTSNNVSSTNGRPSQQESSQPGSQKPSQVGSLYIPPVEPQDMYSNKNNSNNLVNQQTPNWMQTRHQPGQEVPEWANRDQPDAGFSFVQRMPAAQQHYQEAVQQQQQQPPRVVYQQQSQQPQGQQRSTAQTVQSTTNSSSTTTTHRERIIPIQIEQTPSPTKCPTSPGFGPQPYYNMGQQQYSSVQSPGGTVYQQANSNSPSKWSSSV